MQTFFCNESLCLCCMTKQRKACRYNRCRLKVFSLGASPFSCSFSFLSPSLHSSLMFAPFTPLFLPLLCCESDPEIHLGGCGEWCKLSTWLPCDVYVVHMHSTVYDKVWCLSVQEPILSFECVASHFEFGTQKKHLITKLQKINYPQRAVFTVLSCDLFLFLLIRGLQDCRY